MDSFAEFLASFEVFLGLLLVVDPFVKREVQGGFLDSFAVSLGLSLLVGALVMSEVEGPAIGLWF